MCRKIPVCGLWLVFVAGCQTASPVYRTEYQAVSGDTDRRALLEADSECRALADREALVAYEREVASARLTQTTNPLSDAGAQRIAAEQLQSARLRANGDATRAYWGQMNACMLEHGFESVSFCEANCPADDATVTG